jgi:hypothetical protein
MMMKNLVGIKDALIEWYQSNVAVKMVGMRIEKRKKREEVGRVTT